MLYKKRCLKLKKYADQFCDTVGRDFPRLKAGNYPTVNCFRHPGTVPGNDARVKMAERTPDGRALIGGHYNNGIIDIYGITGNLEELKTTVRHECLHWLLDNKGYPYDDSDAIFLLLAILYDANPYGILEYIEEGPIASGQEAEGSGTDGARDALGIPDGTARASFYLS